MELNNRRLREVVALAALLLLGYWSLQNLSLLGSWLSWLVDLVMPFVVGCVLAFILHVPMRTFEKHLPKKLEKGRRAISFFLTLFCAALLLSIVTGLVVPQLATTATTLAKRLPTFWTSLLAQLEQLGEQFPMLAPMLNDMTVPNWNLVVENVILFLKNGGLAFVGNTVSAASGIFGGVMNGIISIIFCIYILFQQETLSRQAKMLLYAFTSEEKARKTIKVGALTEKTFSNFLAGQCLEACILGVIVAIAMLICQMPYITLTSVLVGFTALIPLVGAFLGCGVGVILIAVDDPIKAVWFIVLFIVIQQLEGNLIYPRVVGSSIGLPSMWVLVAVTLGGGIGGVAGMLTMIPLCSVLYTLLRERVYYQLSQRELLDDFHLTNTILSESNAILTDSEPEDAPASTELATDSTLENNSTSQS